MNASDKKPEKSGVPEEGKSFIFPSTASRGRGRFSGIYSSATGRAGIIALHPIAGLLVGGGLGAYLERTFETGNWIFWLFLILGFIAGYRNAAREYRAMLREQDEKRTSALP